jgi:hypothetical protein
MLEMRDNSKDKIDFEKYKQLVRSLRRGKVEKVTSEKNTNNLRNK